MLTISPQWLFWLEGMVTVLVGILAALVLPDWPSTSKFLTEEERALAVKRLVIETGHNSEEQVGFMQSCKAAFSNYHVWLFSLAMYCHSTPARNALHSANADPINQTPHSASPRTSQLSSRPLDTAQLELSS